MSAATGSRSALTGAGGAVAEWLPVKVSDWRLLGLRDRHYAGGVGGKTAGAPGKRLAFVTFEGTAAWMSYFQLPEEVDHDFGTGYLCSMFRNEGAGRSSVLIESAIAMTELRWGTNPEGWLTFVNVNAVRHKRDPGRCFRRCGFVPVGYTRERGYLALRRANPVLHAAQAAPSSPSRPLPGEEGGQK